MTKLQRYENMVNLSVAFLQLISIEEARNLLTIYSILKAKIKKPKKVKSEIIDDKRRSSKAVANLDESDLHNTITTYHILVL